MRSIAKFLATTLIGVAVAGTPILAQTVTIDYDHSVNFLKYKTFTWDRVHATDPNVEDRITIAVNRDMAGRYISTGGPRWRCYDHRRGSFPGQAGVHELLLCRERHQLAARMGQRRFSGYSGHGAGCAAEHACRGYVRHQDAQAFVAWHGDAAGACGRERGQERQCDRQGSHSAHQQVSAKICKVEIDSN